ncbi:hydrogen peroxide-dependent heme synthase [Luteitalea sp.]|uniref:hydrogen peroxide-dependent heme synthase n=1 Tax=Luteitalea sp. TaxID=2004800 RepID=UPI0037CA6722
MLTVPETLEGWCLLHQMFRVSWPALVQATNDERAEFAEGLREFLDRSVAGDGATIAVAMLGHKADLMLVHARRSFDALVQAQLDVSRLPIAEAFESTTSYVSVVELGMYEMTAKIHEQLTERGLAHGTDEYRAAQKEAMQVQHGRVSSRLYTAFPARRYVCFYPMDKRRGEIKNWYSTPFEKRAAMMREHGHIGRLYAGEVTQIISGSIGFDDWEWGVDLFADDPVVFKRLIYEMRFDEASADYGEFGPFYTGVQFSSSQVAEWVEGRTPTLAI